MQTTAYNLYSFILLLFSLWINKLTNNYFVQVDNNDGNEK